MQIHRIAHKRDYTVLSNKTLQDPTLSFNALGILVRMLSRRDGRVVNVRTLAAEGPTGRDAVASGLRELKARGYYFVETAPDPDTGRVLSTTDLYERPRADMPAPDTTLAPAPVREAVLPAQRRSPAAGNPEPGKTGTTPTGAITTGAVPNPPEPAPTAAARTKRTPAAPPPPPGPAAAAVLHHLAATDHRLILGARDRATIAPLIDRWLANGATQGQIISAATLGLPADLRCPAGLLTHRLQTKLPPPPHHLPAPPRPLADHPECRTCDRPLTTPEPTPDGLCGDCRHIRDNPLLPPDHWIFTEPLPDETAPEAIPA
ncbi:hypothetical protein [Kitasatospora sp. NPDC057223]|uniref:hypothetical protein n=1 Tax=Kitasatospora sp. NPDC057223 TaxID=3346055 RepID=UPI0036287691